VTYAVNVQRIVLNVTSRKDYYVCSQALDEYNELGRKCVGWEVRAARFIEGYSMPWRPTKAPQNSQNSTLFQVKVQQSSIYYILFSKTFKTTWRSG
jgi:hypothetical protein